MAAGIRIGNANKGEGGQALALNVGVVDEILNDIAVKYLFARPGSTRCVHVQHAPITHHSAPRGTPHLAGWWLVARLRARIPPVSAWRTINDSQACTIPNYANRLNISPTLLVLARYPCLHPRTRAGPRAPPNTTQVCGLYRSPIGARQEAAERPPRWTLTPRHSVACSQRYAFCGACV